MKSFITTACISSLLLIGSYAECQQPNAEPEAPTQGQFSNMGAMIPQPYHAYGPNVLGSAVQELKKAETDEEKSAAQAKLKAELEKQYEAFLKKDQARVDQLFDRLKELETQLERRRAAKDRLVKLKLEMLVSQAEGLGWPTDPSMVSPQFLPMNDRPVFQPAPLNNPGYYPVQPGRTLSPPGSIQGPATVPTPTRSTFDPSGPRGPESLPEPEVGGPLNPSTPPPIRDRRDPGPSQSGRRR